MEKIGLSDELRVELLAKVNLIGFGRKALYTPNQSEKGRELYTEGISGAFAIFQEVHIIKAPATFIQAEFVFVTQELDFCDESEKLTIASL